MEIMRGRGGDDDGVSGWEVKMREERERKEWRKKGGRDGRK